MHTPEATSKPYLRSSPEHFAGLDFEVRASLDAAVEAWARIDRWLSRLELPVEARQPWRLAFTEAFNNAVLHGSSCRISDGVTIRLSARGDWVELTVTDCGKGFPSEWVTEVREPVDETRTSGRGLFLIRHHTHELECWYNPGRFSLVMRRRHPELNRGVLDNPDLTRALEEISQCYESLAGFYRLGEALIQARSPAEFVQQAVTDLAQLIRTDRLEVSFSRDLDSPIFEELGAMECHVHNRRLSAAERTALIEGEEFYWENSAELEEPGRLEGMRSGFVCPVRAGQRTLGVLVGQRIQSGQGFSAGELSMARTFADLVGIAVAHAESLVVRVREQEALRELEIVRRLEQEMLPAADLPVSNRWAITVRREAAREVAGDYADALLTPSGRLILALTDVMGKGASAFFFVGILRAVFRAVIDQEPALPELVTYLNRHLEQVAGRTSLFATAAFVELSADGTRFSVVNAGHCPVLMRDRQNGWLEFLPANPPLGIFPGEVYRHEEYTAREIVQVILATDGVYEWTVNGDPWGLERFRSFIKSSPFDANGQRIWQDLRRTMEETADAGQNKDDLTFLEWRSL